MGPKSGFKKAPIVDLRDPDPSRKDDDDPVHARLKIDHTNIFSAQMILGLGLDKAGVCKSISSPLDCYISVAIAKRFSSNATHIPDMNAVVSRTVAQMTRSTL